MNIFKKLIAIILIAVFFSTAFAEVRTEYFRDFADEPPYPKSSEINYKNNKKHGLGVYWNSNGYKVSEINYKNDKNHGLFTQWYDNGKKKYKTNYKDDKQHGLETAWHESGEKWFEECYQNSKKVDMSYCSKQTAKTQQPKTTTNNYDIKQGLETVWHDNGKKSAEGNMKGDKLDGLWTFWRESGEKWFEECYQNNKAVDMSYCSKQTANNNKKSSGDNCFKLLDKGNPLVFRNDCSFNIIPSVCEVGRSCGGYNKSEYLISGEKGIVDFNSLLGATKNNGYPTGTYIRYKGISNRFKYGYCKAPKKRNRKGKCK